MRQFRSEAGHLALLRSAAQIVLINRRSAQGALLALVAVSAAGTADVAEFLATRPAMLTDAPGRAVGTVIGLGLWLAVLGIATTRYIRRERPGQSSATMALAGLLAAGNLGLAAIHLKVGVGGVRPFVGGALGILAFILAVASRERVSD